MYRHTRESLITVSHRVRGKALWKEPVFSPGEFFKMEGGGGVIGTYTLRLEIRGKNCTLLISK